MAQPSLLFSDQRELIDGIMLFGGSLSPSNPGGEQRVPGTCLGIARSRDLWASVYWAKVLIELHGIRMHLAVGPETITQKLGFKSHASVLFTRSFRTWYPNGKHAQTPESLELTESMFIMWLVDAMSRYRGDGPIRLTSPRLSHNAAHSLSRHIIRMGWICNVQPTTGGNNSIYIAANNQLSRLEEFLGQYVPPSIWRIYHTATSRAK